VARIVKRTRKIMADHSNSPGKPKFSAKIIKERLRTMTAWLEQVEDFARALDWLGAAEKHAEGPK
jgi:hypothetical protein